MTADELDTAAIRAKLAAHNFLHRDFALDLCDEIDRLREALAFHVDNSATGGGASARAAGGVQPAPAAEVCQCSRPMPAPDVDSGVLFCLHCDGLASAAGSTDQPPAEACGAVPYDSTVGPCHLVSGHPSEAHCSYQQSQRWSGNIWWADDEPSAGGSTDGAGTPGAEEPAKTYVNHVWAPEVVDYRDRARYPYMLDGYRWTGVKCSADDGTGWRCGFPETHPIHREVTE